ALKATVRTFPRSDFYDLEELLTQLGIGEAAVAILNENRVPTHVLAAHERERRADTGRPHKDPPAALEDGVRVRRGGRGEGLPALRQVRHARRRSELAGDAGRTHGPP